MPGSCTCRSVLAHSSLEGCAWSWTLSWLSILCSWHVERPPPFAFVTADQQVQPFGKTLAPKQAHPHPFNLRVDDIPGAKPKEHCFATSPRLTNPLEPCYQLPHADHAQPAPPVPRFIRNAMDNSDIPGAQVEKTSASTSITIFCRPQPFKAVEICSCNDQ